MDGEKFQQAQAATKYVLNHLNPQDRFGLVTFSSNVEHYASGLRNANEAPEASTWLDNITASGSTDINLALLDALGMADSTRPTYLIFLTDGQPTIGETDRQKIIENFNQAAPHSIRLFTFGVGYDVDTFLLDSLAQGHHGLSSYVQPGQNLEEVISGFYASISIPVLTNLSLVLGELSVSDIYPNPLPDLFSGSQVVIVGRYATGGTVDVTLKGDVNGQPQTFTFPEQIFSADSQNGPSSLTSLPRLWATRKVGYLLNQVRLQGPDKETIDQIVKLSIRYGIVTPYTSYLVTEPMPLGAENQQRVADNAYQQALAAPALSVSGKGAVDQSAGQGGMSQAQQAPSPIITSASGSSAEAVQTIQVVGARTFVYSQGIWTDTAYDPGTMHPQQIIFLSAEYFTLAEAHPDLAAAFAIGSLVIVVVDGKVYQVANDAVVSSTSGTPTTLTPAVTTPVPFGGATTVSGSIITPTIPVDQTAQPGPDSVIPWIGLAVAAAAAAILTLRKKKE
jgi:Ca-activated chloride channel family protein